MAVKFEITPIKDNAVSYAIKNRSIYTLPEGEDPMYLSDWFEAHPEVFRDGKFYNQDQSESKFILIFAGVGAGKTYFATHILGQYGNVFFNCSRAVIREQQKEYFSKADFKKLGSDAESEYNSDGTTIDDTKSCFVEKSEEGYSKYIGTSWSLKNPVIFERAATSQYLVIDEAHHMFSDSFCDAPNYVHELLQNHSDGKTIILMTACANFMKEAFEQASKIENMDPLYSHFDEVKYGELFKLPMTSAFAIDLRFCCRNLHPQSVKVISPKYAARLINKMGNEESKILYFCLSAKRAYSIACRLIMNDKRAVAITSSGEKKKPIIRKITHSNLLQTANRLYQNEKYITYNSKQLKKALNYGYARYNKLLSLKNLNDKEEQTLKVVEEGIFPADVDILVSTTKLREGANLNISEMDVSKKRYVFTEVYDEVNLTQVIGRIRTEISTNCNFDCLYIVLNRQNYNLRLEQIRRNPPYIPQISDDILRGLALMYREEIKDKTQNEYCDVVAVFQEITKKINANTVMPGQVYIQPIRSGYEINTIAIVRNPLWYINFLVNEKNRAISSFSFDETQSESQKLIMQAFVRKVSDIIPSATIEVIHKNYDEADVISIIHEYCGDAIHRDQIQELYSRLVDAGFILPGDHMWHAIRKLNQFECKPTSSRRQKYQITRQAQSQIELEQNQ